MFTLVPDTLYHSLPLEKLCANPKYSVVTKIPGVPFSNENCSYSLRCSTFVQNINWPSDAFYNKELQRSIYSVNTQGANIHDVNINSAYEIMESVKSINIHDSIIIDTIAHNTTSKNTLNTTFNNVFNNIITDANTIIDSAKAINKSAREIIYNASSNIHQINKAANVTHDTIAHASTNISTNATKVALNSKYYNSHDFSIHEINIHSVNICNANEIISAADKMISKASNDISLADEARKKFVVDKALKVCESSHGWSSWESIIVPVAYTTITLTVCTASAHLCKLAWLFFN